MLTLNEQLIWDTLVEYGIATDEEIDLVVKINGQSAETLNSILYARTGFRTIESFVCDGCDEEGNWE
jgi:hypothetical protein